MELAGMGFTCSSFKFWEQKVYELILKVTHLWLLGGIRNRGFTIISPCISRPRPTCYGFAKCQILATHIAFGLMERTGEYLYIKHCDINSHIFVILISQVAIGKEIVPFIATTTAE